MDANIEYVKFDEYCSQCLVMRQIENARLARRALASELPRRKFTFELLVAYGKTHFDSKIQCYNCQKENCKQ